ncbi:MAG: ATP-binding protein [Clostridiales bacterium]|jgi:predicted AAA+ superfamily ATPase|nr:ATP-binding protein [Clostridiales bacterium]
MHFEREIEKDLLAWKQQRDGGIIEKNLLVTGARQTGKTTVLSRTFPAAATEPSTKVGNIRS